MAELAQIHSGRRDSGKSLCRVDRAVTSSLRLFGKSLAGRQSLGPQCRGIAHSGITHVDIRLSAVARLYRDLAAVLEAVTRRTGRQYGESIAISSFRPLFLERVGYLSINRARAGRGTSGRAGTVRGRATELTAKLACGIGVRSRPRRNARIEIPAEGGDTLESR